MNKTHAKTHEKRQGRENKIFKNFAKFFRVQEMTMNEKLTMIGLIANIKNICFLLIQHLSRDKNTTTNFFL